MIQILPVTDSAFLSKLNQTYQKEAQFATVYIEKREVKASCLYQLAGEVCHILHISTLDPEIFDGLVRAVFASAIQKGINQGSFEQDMNKEMLELLGFVQDDTFFVNSLTKIIQKCGKC